MPCDFKQSCRLSPCYDGICYILSVLALGKLNCIINWVFLFLNTYVPHKMFHSLLVSVKGYSPAGITKFREHYFYLTHFFSNELK